VADEPEKGQQEKSIEMRVAELEDKLNQMHVSEEDMATYQRVAGALGQAAPGTAAASCVVSCSGCLNECLVRACTITQQCTVLQCIIRHCIIRDCWECFECGGGWGPAGPIGRGGFGRLGG
jgi:hypothetical protein